MRTLRPLSLGDIFDAAFDLYKDNFVLLLLVSAVSVVPLTVVVGVIEQHFLHNMGGLRALFGGQVPDITQLFAVLGTVAGALAVLAPIYAIGLGLHMTALAAASSARYLGTPCTLKDAYFPVLRHLGPFVLAALLWGVCIGLGASVCYVGVTVPLVLLAFTAHAFAVDEQWRWRFWRPLGRSRKLVSGQGGRVFGALCILGLVYFLLALGIELPMSYLLHALLGLVPGLGGLGSAPTGIAGVSAADQIIDQICSGVSSMALLPFQVCVLTVLYFDLRVRKEAFDIVLLARELGYPSQPWIVPNPRPRRLASAQPPAKGISR